jgi:hypothetical protein
MKSLQRLIAITVIAGFLAATSAFAGECCKQTAKDVKAGKTCEKCVTAQCCKDAAHKLADKGKAKACEKCAAKKKDEKKS